MLCRVFVLGFVVVIGIVVVVEVVIGIGIVANGEEASSLGSARSAMFP